MCVKCFQNANLVICTSTTYMIYNSNIHHTIILNIIASNSYLPEYVYTIFVLTREFELDMPLEILEGTQEIWSN